MTISLQTVVILLGLSSNSLSCLSSTFQTIRGNELCKDRSGSIVTETIKSRILISVDIPKELAYNADPKYARFLALPVKGYETVKICLIFKMEKNPVKVKKSSLKSQHQIQCIIEPYCRGFTFPSLKVWNLAFFAKKRSRMRVCLLLFFQGNGIKP